MTSAATIAETYNTGLPNIEVVKLTAPAEAGSYYYSQKFQTVKACLFCYAAEPTDAGHTYYVSAISGNRVTLILDDGSTGTAADIWLLLVGQ